MLSIIVCSRSAQLSNLFLQNVSESVGVDYEIIVIDNSANSYSIFSAYNEGVRRSTGEYLCFVHEDISFCSFEWGKIVIEKLADEKIGIIGVVGSDYMPKCPAGWWMTSTKGHEQKEVIDNGLRKKCIVKYSGSTDMGGDAVIVDGFWFCMRRNMFDLVKFDEDRFVGFHCYDNDICMQVVKSGRKIVLADNILIEHKSEGVLNKQWVSNANIWYKKWKKSLPVYVTKLDKDKSKAIMSHCCNKYSTLSFACGKYGLAFRYYLKSIFLYPYKLSKYKIFIVDYVLHKKNK